MAQAADAHGPLSAWQSLAKDLSTRLDKPFENRTLSDEIKRVLDETGPPSVVAAAFGRAFEQDTVFLDFAELDTRRVPYPVLGWSPDGAPFLVIGRTLRGRFQTRRTDATGTLTEATLTRAEMKRLFKNGVSFRPVPPIDVWGGVPAFENTKHWFRGSMGPLLGSMRYLILAALVGNILAVGVSLFALQVWDRVIPAQSLHSLAVLALGVTIAVLFELVLRLQRASLIDDVGRLVDRKISAGVFAHMLDMKSDARPSSLGSLAAQIREINQIREAISSSMVSAAIDLPFVFVYIGVIFLIGGHLVYPLVAAVPVVILMGLFAQIPLSRLAREGLQEASLRNGLIVESVLKSDEIKLLEAESTMRLRWEKTVDVANTVSNKQRRWKTFLTNTTQSIQQLAYVGVVCLGAIAVIGGDITMGQVIACSILANRAIAPLTQVSVVMGAIQGSIAAKHSIDDLMSRPAGTPDRTHLRRSLKTPDYALRAVKYTYKDTAHVSLMIPRLDIFHGERVGIIGRIGSGKSTLLKLLSGLVEPAEGTVLLDKTEMAQIHRSDVRRAVGYQAQSASLLRGTIRDNLAIARPSATDEEMIAACDVAGALALIRDTPRGLDLMVNEAGEGLSVGQKQSLFLARTILREPRIVLMDEPTAAMDDQTELAFIESLKGWAGDRTLVIATHRLRPLSICNRLIMINNGRIAMDGPKDEVMEKLRQDV